MTRHPRIASVCIAGLCVCAAALLACKGGAKQDSSAARVNCT